MTTSRLRNRKTGAEWDVHSSWKTPVNKQSLFAQTLEVSEMENFVQQVAAHLPKTLPQAVKQQLLLCFRKQYIAGNHDLKMMNAEVMEKLLDECRQYAIKENLGKDGMTLTDFFKIIGGALLNSQLTSAYPVLAVLANVVPTAANVARVSQQASYVYHEGQPVNGESLCLNAIYKCIEGHITRLNEEWTPELPQISAESANELAVENCVGQEGLAAMLRRAYRGPTPDMRNCTIASTLSDGSNLTVTATNVNELECNLMRDSVVGLSPCDSLSTSSSETYNGINDGKATLVALGIVAGGASLVGLLYGLYKLVEQRRLEAQLRHGHSLC